MIPPDKRQAALAQLRHRKMARSAHSYVRGSTAKFYDWLERSGVNLPHGPSVWICGDCHMGNLGPTADAKGRVAVQIRDLDQTVIGNPAHDIVRLGLSLASAARGADLSGIVTARMLEGLIAGYQRALAGDDKAAARPHKPRQIQALLNDSLRRRWHHLARERLRDVEPSIPLGKKFWPPTEDERLAVRALIKGQQARRVLTRLTDRDDDDDIHLVDLAYWVKGCSSLGRLRFAALVGFGRDNRNGYCLVDIKEGVAPAAPRDLDKAMPADNAARVVAGARALSPHLGQRMFHAALLDRPVVVRELMPQDLKIEIQQMKEAEAVRIADYLGAVVGRAHGRQMSTRDIRAWNRELDRHRPKTLDAPTWLWTSVVELMGIHEAAYLEHCRRIIASAA